MQRFLLVCFAVLLAACSAPQAQQSPVSPTDPPSPAATAPAAPEATVRSDGSASLLPTDAPIEAPVATAPVAPTTAASTNPDSELAALAALERTPRDLVALARSLTEQRDAPDVARTTPLEVQLGDAQNFWVTSTANDSTYSVTAELRYSGPVVLMYVEQGLELDQAALEQAAQTFEQQIYPRTRALFGSEWQPGVDGDNRITVLNARSPGGGVAGYFSSRDLVPRSVNRFSNEREMFFMNAESVAPGTTAYLDVLTHEFQHMIHWNEQPDSAIWFNEGSSTLSEDLNGFISHSFAMAYLAKPDTQLTAWSEVPGQSIAHYGAANLFMRYIYAQYAGEQGIAPLIRADAGNNPEVFVDLAAATRPDITDFSDLYADWTVANLLNDSGLADGRYTYAGPLGDDLLPSTIIPLRVDVGTVNNEVHQFGADYLQLPPGPLTVAFTGSTSVNLVGAPPQGRYAWWSGRGDNSISTLTHAVDLRELATATLRFDVWYELESSYDYAYASVSTDGGTTWQRLRGNHTTDEDPHGSNYGNGFNGVSGDPDLETSSDTRGVWVEELMDLTPFAGQEVLLRFWQISDDAFNAPGMLVDNIRVCSNDATPACVFEDDVETSAGAWQPEGFARVDGDLPQLWEVRLVRTAADGTTQIEELMTDETGSTTATLEPNERAIMIIAGATPHTTEEATYQLVLTE